MEFTNWDGEHFDTFLSDPNFRGGVSVYEPGFGISVSVFFRKMANEWEGAEEKQWTWVSLEGELSTSATCDLTGHTTLRVAIQKYNETRWQLEGTLVLEGGQLRRIARTVENYFRRN